MIVDPLAPPSLPALLPPLPLRCLHVGLHGLLGWFLALALGRHSRERWLGPLAAALFIAHPLASELVVRLPFAASSLLSYLAALASAPLVALVLLRILRSRWLRLSTAVALVLAAAVGTAHRAVPFTSAELYWARRVSTSPRDAGAKAALGALYAGQGRLEEARRVLLQALELRPDLCAARAALGQLEIDRGKLAAGLEQLRRSVRCAPSLASRRRLAFAALRFGLPAEAERQARQALALGERRSERDLRYLLGRSLQLQGKFAEAGQEYRALVAAGVRSWRPKLELVRVEVARCQLAEARRLLKELRERDDLPVARRLAVEHFYAQALRRCPSVRVDQSVRVKVKSSK